MTIPSLRSGNRRFRPAPPKARTTGRGPVAKRTGTGLVSKLRDFARGLALAPRRAEVLQALLDATTTTRVPERMAANVVELALDWVGGDGWAVLAVGQAGGFHWLADRGVTRGRRAAMTTAAGRAVTRARIIWSFDAAPAGVTRGRSDASIVAIPVKLHGRPVAVLVGLEATLAPRAPELLPDERHLEALVPLANAIAGSLDAAMRLKRAAALSSIDDLTGLYNARFLAGALRREVKRASRSLHPLSLLFVDLDGFKGVNDRHGHLCGSRALVEAAGVIHSGARETDVVARYGGDEFALVLPDTGPGGAMLVARRIRERIADYLFLVNEGIGYRLTASVGAATLTGGVGTPEELLAAADAAMYRVKGRGKNGIEMADPAALSRPQ
jgi:diguanylate cyclase (GGDEF)-like protein